MFLFCISLIPLFGVGLLPLGIWYVWCKGTRLSVSEFEVVFETGLLTKSRIDMRVENVRTVRVDQTLFQRMLGTGTITVYTAGDNPEFLVSGMPDPLRAREALRKTECGSQKNP